MDKGRRKKKNKQRREKWARLCYFPFLRPGEDVSTLRERGKKKTLHHFSSDWVVKSFLFFFLQLKKSACRLCIFEESSRCWLILGIFLFESVTFFLILAESSDFVCSGRRELSVPFSQNLPFKDTEIWITRLCETMLHIFPQMYALFRKTPLLSFITLRSDDSDARRPSDGYAPALEFAAPLVIPSPLLFSQERFFPFFFFPLPQDPLRFDSYYISQIRSSLRWHNSSWWLDLG